MIKQLANNSTRTLVALLTFVILHGCSAHSKQVNACRSSYKKARADLNAYYKDHDSSMLGSSLADADLAMRCVETRQAAVEMKISLLALMKSFRKGYEFVISLNESDFTMSYKKTMGYQYFLAMDADARGDTLLRNRIFKNICFDIETYIRNENLPAGKLNEVAYYDLYKMKTKIRSQSQLGMEIDSLKQRYPASSEFFDVLKGSLTDTVVTYAMPPTTY